LVRGINFISVRTLLHERVERVHVDAQILRGRSHGGSFNETESILEPRTGTTRVECWSLFQKKVVRRASAFVVPEYVDRVAVHDAPYRCAQSHQASAYAMDGFVVSRYAKDHLVFRGGEPHRQRDRQPEGVGFRVQDTQTVGVGPVPQQCLGVLVMTPVQPDYSGYQQRKEQRRGSGHHASKDSPARSVSSAARLRKRGSPIAPLAMYFTTTRNQVLFHVAVYDPSLHRIRSAWIRFGSRWLGLLDADAINVEWEHEP
jgi:hypothetical protein